MSKWKKVKLGDVATYINGCAFKPSDWSFQGVPIVRIQNLTGSFSETNYYDKPYNSKYEINNGDVLISWSASLGVYVWNKGTAILNQHIFKVVFDKINIDKNYFVFAVKSLLEKMEKQTHGATMKHITKPLFDNMSFPLPEMEEQKKIAARLDAVSDLLAKQKQLLAEQDTLIQSLFYNMFGDPIKNNKGWKIENLGNIAELVDGDRGKNYPKESDFSNNGYCLFLNTGNINDMKFDFSNCQFISKEKDSILRKGKLERKDIVFTTRGTIGKIAFYDASVSYEHIRINSGMVIIRNLIGISFIFFLHYFSNPLIYKNLLSGTAQPQIPIGNLQKAKIILPPLELQEKFAAIVEQIESEKSKIKSAIAETQTLFNALMAEYFEE